MNKIEKSKLFKLAAITAVLGLTASTALADNLESKIQRAASQYMQKLTEAVSQTCHEDIVEVARHPIFYAAKEGNLEMVQSIIEEQNFDVNTKYEKDGSTALHWAAYGGQYDVVKYLVEHGADVNAKDNNDMTPLMDAAQEGHLEVVKYLVEHGADVNAKHGEDWTALTSAARKGHLDVVKYLAEHGAEVTDRDWEQAVGSGNLDLVRYFVEEQGANVNHRSHHNVPEFGVPVVTRAISSPDVMKYLVEHGADVNVMHLEEFGDGYFDMGNLPLHKVTPLTKAVTLQNLDAVKYLVEHGANVNAGFPTPLSIAKGDDFVIENAIIHNPNGNKEIADYLQSVGAK